MATGGSVSDSPTFGRGSEPSVGSLDGVSPIHTTTGGATLKAAVPGGSEPSQPAGGLQSTSQCDGKLGLAAELAANDRRNAASKLSSTVSFASGVETAAANL